MMRTFTFTLASIQVVLAACGDPGSGGIDATPYWDAAPDAAGSPRARIGGIEVIETRAIFDDGTGPMEQRWSQVWGEFFADRAANFHREVMTSGACTLRAYTPSLCDPACTDALCVEPDVCEPWPTRVSAGELTITGLTAPVSITPQSGYYYPTNPLPADLFADGATITAQLAGDVIPALALESGGVPLLEPQITDKIVLAPGTDHTVTWTPVGVGRVRLTLNSNNQGHGLPYLGIIDCDVDDSAGEITIAAALIDAFPETQAWTVCAGTDCPPSVIRRYRSDAAPIGADQEVRLVVTSQFTFGVDHILPD
jgi:hypothetical protein